MKNDLANFTQLLKAEGIKVEAKTTFNNYSLMFDLARGRVLNLEYFKDLLSKVARFGVNEVWLYLEDVYRLNEPFFGYNRGAYSQEELMALDAHADSVGIELVFAIQTLGHMENFLRWPSSYKYRDTHDIMLAESNDTYLLIKKMFNFCRKSFKSSKIHIGLDETFNVGRGQYMVLNGLHKQRDIFINHLKKVRTLAIEAGYEEVLIWSDMFVKLSFNFHDYYQNIDTSKITKPMSLSKLNLVYWDYYNIDSNKVGANLDLHLKLTKNTTFASGIWIWQRPTVDFKKSFETTEVAIKQCVLKKIKDINFTLWNDNGGYCNPDDFLILLPHISEHIFNLPTGTLAPLYQKITKKDYVKQTQRSVVNNLPNMDAITILYDDPIYGMYLDQKFKYAKKDLTDAILMLNEFDITKYKNDPEFYYLFQIIKLKLQTRVVFNNNITNHENLLLLIPQYKELAKAYQEYLNIFTKGWQKTSKENGLEMHQYRLAGLKLRVEHLINLIKNKTDFTTVIDEPNAKQELNTLFDTVAYTLRLNNY